MFKEIPSNDIVVRDFVAYKERLVTQNEVAPLYGVNSTGSYDPDTDSVNLGGISKRLLYSSIYSLFYRNPSISSPINDFGLRISHSSTDERVIGEIIGIISLPKEYYGERIQPGSLKLTLNDNLEITDDHKSNLKDQVGNHKGNIFYDKGLVIITDSVVDEYTLSSYSLQFNSTKTIFETEVFIPILEHEFNVSQNPTAYNQETGDIRLFDYTSSIDPSKTGGFGDYLFSSSVDLTGSYLAPYITTIGLYDDDNQMVAVAKLGFPIKSLPDYPVNFLIRLDT